jgi:hypothetical protein
MNSVKSFVGIAPGLFKTPGIVTTLRFQEMDIWLRSMLKPTPVHSVVVAQKAKN